MTRRMTAAAIAAAALLAAAAPATAQEPRREFKLGVVDLKRCFDKASYQKVKDINGELQGYMDALRGKVKELETNIDKTRQAIDGIARDATPKLWEDKRRQLAIYEAQLKFEKDMGKTRYLDFYADKMIEVYNEVRRIVSAIAQEQKFDLVLRVEQPLLEEQDQEGLTSRINSRVVLYHHSGVDITNDVLKRLNEEYEKTRLTSKEWDCKECGKKSKGDACSATPNCKGKRP